MNEIQNQNAGSGNAEAQRRQQEEMRTELLHQILLPEARERLSRIAIVKPDKVRSVEDNLLRLAQSGKLQAQVTEQQLIQMLEQFSSSGAKQTTKVTIQRRRGFSDDEDDDDF